MVTLSGAHFLPGARVSIGNSLCSQTTAVSATTLTCFTPAGTAGPATVHFTNGDGQSTTLTEGFVYNEIPVLTALVPNNGRLSGGQQIQLHGRGFRPGIEVLLGNLPCASVELDVLGTRIVCTTPAHAAGSVDVVVANPNTQVATLARGYFYNLPPVVTSVSPSNGALSGGVTLLLSGSGFSAKAAVMVGSKSCLNVRISNGGTTAHCETPAQNISGSIDVLLVNADTQQSILTNAFTYNPLPILENVQPDWGDVQQNTSVTLTGAHFLPGALVRLSGVACDSVAVVSNTQIKCVARSSLSAGTRDVLVTNSDGQSGGLPNAFTYQSLDLTCEQPSFSSLAGKPTSLACPAAASSHRPLQYSVSGCNAALTISAAGVVTGAMPFAPCTATITVQDGLLARTQEIRYLTTRPPLRTNGSVYTLVPLADGSTLLGGSFTAVNPDPAPGPGLLKVATAGGIDASFNPGLGFNGNVNTSVLLPDGSLLVGGDFTSYNGKPASRLAHLNAQGELDTAFNPPTGENGTNGPVFAIAVAGSEIYVGGRFTKVRNHVANNIARLRIDGSVNLEFSPATGENGTNQSVYAIAVSENNLFVGGAFSTYRGVSAQSLVKLNFDGSLTPSFLKVPANASNASNGTNGNVNALLVWGNALYIGGSFDSYRGPHVL